MIILSIQFTRSRSATFNEILKECRIMNGFVEIDSKSFALNLDNKYLFEHWYHFARIHHYITKWKGTYVYFMNELIFPYKNDLFYSLQDISYCAKNYGGESECFNDIRVPGLKSFGCKKIEKIRRNLLFNTSFNYIYWYQFGHFETLNKYVIEKDSLLIALKQEINSTCVNACPYFDYNRVATAVNSLPDFIDLDRSRDSWQIIWDDDYSEGYLKKVPVKLEPVPAEKDNYKRNQLIKTAIENLIIKSDINNSFSKKLSNEINFSEN